MKATGKGMVAYRVAAGAILTLAGILASGASLAQSYPAKTIRIIMPFAAGQSTDISGRIVAQGLAARLGQPVVVENRPGADGVVGASYVAGSPPDGYTLLIGTSGTHGAAVALFKDLPYDPVKDFAPVSRLFTVFYILVVRSGHPANTLAELVALARKNPGQVSIANTAGIAYLTGEFLKQAAGIDMLDVPHKSNAQAFSDVVTGRIDTMFISPASALPQIKAGQVKALGITSLNRSAQLPGVPTIAESGYPGFESTPSPALFAPARTPREIITRLHAETVAVLKDPAIREILRKNGTTDAEIIGSTPEELAASIKAELTTWARVSKQGIRGRD